MSIQQFFNEVEAVVQVLSEYVESVNPPHNNDDDSFELSLREDGPTIEQFTAIWQAAELLSRAYSYIMPQVQAEMAKAALVLPDVQQEAPKTPKKGRLYGPNGMPL